MADQGDVVLIVSSFTPVEVLKLKNQKPITKAEQNKIREFFEKDYFRFVDLTRRVGESAQTLIWDYPGLWPKDAVHLASAIQFERISGLHLDAIHSYDEHFLKLHGKLPTKAPIEKPLPPQGVMRKLLAQVEKRPKPKKRKKHSN